MQTAERKDVKDGGKMVRTKGNKLETASGKREAEGKREV